MKTENYCAPRMALIEFDFNTRVMAGSTTVISDTVTNESFESDGSYNDWIIL